MYCPEQIQGCFFAVCIHFCVPNLNFYCLCLLRRLSWVSFPLLFFLLVTCTCTPTWTYAHTNIKTEKSGHAKATQDIYDRGMARFPAFLLGSFWVARGRRLRGCAAREVATAPSAQLAIPNLDPTWWRGGSWTGKGFSPVSSLFLGSFFSVFYRHGVWNMGGDMCSFNEERTRPTESPTYGRALMEKTSDIRLQPAMVADAAQKVWPTWRQDTLIPLAQSEAFMKEMQRPGSNSHGLKESFLCEELIYGSLKEYKPIKAP